MNDEELLHQADKSDFYEQEFDRLIVELSAALGESPSPVATRKRRTDWKQLILKRLAQDCATYDELLGLIQEKRGHGGINSRDILTGVLNQLDDDGLIYLNRAYGCVWYHLSKRGRRRMEHAA